MERDEDLYEIAFREVETGQMDTPTWAKAYAMSDDHEHAKKLYIQFRVTQIKNSSRSDSLDTSDSDSESSIAQESKLVEDPLPESKTPSWLDSLVNIILVVPPAALVGALMIGGSSPLDAIIPKIDNGITWFTLLWPFALVYWLVKRQKRLHVSMVKSSRSDKVLSRDDPIKGKGKYKDGKKDGLVEWYYENGQLERKVNYKEGKQDGLVEWYYENGQLEGKGNYKDEKKDGLWKVYHENGQVKGKFNYKDGKQDGVVETYYANGQLKSKTNYKDGERDGLVEMYHENGDLWHQSNFKDGKLL